MRFLSGWVLVAVLAACAPSTSLSLSSSQRADWKLQFVVKGFQPNKGMGSTYKVGEYATFSFTLTKGGYVTLVGLDPDGSLQELERNIPLSAGPQLLPLKTDKNTQGAQAAYVLTEPTGSETMWLIYTDVPGAADARFRGKPNAQEFSQLLYKFITPATVRDIAETKFEVTK